MLNSVLSAKHTLLTMYYNIIIQNVHYIKNRYNKCHIQNNAFANLVKYKYMLCIIIQNSTPIIINVENLIFCNYTFTG